MQVRNFKTQIEKGPKLNRHGNVEVASGPTLVSPLKISSTEPYTAEKSASCKAWKCALCVQ